MTLFFFQFIPSQIEIKGLKKLYLKKHIVMYSWNQKIKYNNLYVPMYNIILQFFHFGGAPLSYFAKYKIAVY